jgi:hypothetical protein
MIRLDGLNNAIDELGIASDDFLRQASRFPRNALRLSDAAE